MTPRAETVDERVQLEATDSGYRAVWVEHTWRFLMADGSTVDVIAARDDSDVRHAVNRATKLDIVGVVRLPEDDDG